SPIEEEAEQQLNVCIYRGIAVLQDTLFEDIADHFLQKKGQTPTIQGAQHASVDAFLHDICQSLDALQVHLADSLFVGSLGCHLQPLFFAQVDTKKLALTL